MSLNLPDRTVNTAGDKSPARQRSSRALSNVQRDRKRETDRNAQRTIRAKTKRYISHLESLVEQGQKPGVSTQELWSLLGQLKESQERARYLADALDHAQRLIAHETNGNFLNNAFASAVEDSSRQKEMPHSPPSSLILQTRSETRRQPQLFNPINMKPGGQGLEPTTDGSIAGTPLDENIRQQVVQPDLELPGATPVFTSGSISLHTASDLYSHLNRTYPKATTENPQTPTQWSMRYLPPPQRMEREQLNKINVLLDQAVHTMPANGSLNSVLVDDDILIRSIYQGWSESSRGRNLDSGWQALRSIDEEWLSELTSNDRLAILCMMRSIMCHQVSVRTTTMNLGSDAPDLRPLPTWLCRKFSASGRPPRTVTAAGFLLAILRHQQNPHSRPLEAQRQQRAHPKLLFSWPTQLESFQHDSAYKVYKFVPQFFDLLNDLWQWTPRASIAELRESLEDDCVRDEHQHQSYPRNLTAPCSSNKDPPFGMNQSPIASVSVSIQQYQESPASCRRIFASDAEIKNGSYWKQH